MVTKNNKGAIEVQIPMSCELSLDLAGLATDAPSYLLTDYGKPLASSGSLEDRVRKWTGRAGLIGEDGNEPLAAWHPQAPC